MTGREDQASVFLWSQDVFPGPADDPHKGRRSQGLKLIQEAVELAVSLGCTPAEIMAAAFIQRKPGGPDQDWHERRSDPGNVGKEIGDCCVVLCVLAGRTGHDIGVETDAAMKTNRLRKWDIRPDGSAQHKDTP